MATLSGGAVLKSFFEYWDSLWLKHPEIDELKKRQRWLILGKGPTFADRDRYDLKRYFKLCLNDSVRFMPEEYAHFVDWEAFERCVPYMGSDIHVIMPWHPHVGFKPSTHSLPELLVRHDYGFFLDRTAYYHAATAKGRGAGPGDPIVPLKNFSAEAAVWLLAMAGVKTIRTLGVDGGTGYAREFLDAGLTPLENGRKSFDSQTAEIAKAVEKFELDYRPLDERGA